MKRYQHQKKWRQKSRSVRLIMVGLVVGVVAGGSVTAAAVTNNLSLGAGDTSHVTCAGSSLSVANQAATSLDLTCNAPAGGIAPSGATYVYQGTATTNYSTAPVLDASALTYRTLLQFPTPVPS